MPFGRQFTAKYVSPQQQKSTSKEEQQQITINEKPFKKINAHKILYLKNNNKEQLMPLDSINTKDAIKNTPMPDFNLFEEIKPSASPPSFLADINLNSSEDLIPFQSNQPPLKILPLKEERKLNINKVPLLLVKTPIKIFDEKEQQINGDKKQQQQSDIFKEQQKESYDIEQQQKQQQQLDNLKEQQQKQQFDIVQQKQQINEEYPKNNLDKQQKQVAPATQLNEIDISGETDSFEQDLINNSTKILNQQQNPDIIDTNVKATLNVYNKTTTNAEEIKTTTKTLIDNEDLSWIPFQSTDSLKINKNKEQQQINDSIFKGLNDFIESHKNNNNYNNNEQIDMILENNEETKRVG